MLQTVEVRTAAGTLLSLPLDDVADGLVLTDVEGLDPVKAIFSFSSFAQQDGVQFQSTRREARFLILKFDLEPDYATDTVQDLRFRLYDFFMTERPVSFKFIDSGGLTVDIEGRVEDCQAPLFVKEPKMNVYVTCPNPDLVDMTPVEVSGSTVADTTETLVAYPGSVNTGFIFTLNVDRTIDGFTVYHRAPDNTVRSVDIAADLIADDVVTINSVIGEKSVTLTRAGVTTSIMYGRSTQSKWFELEKGDNYIRAYVTGAAIPWEISYYKRYGGL